VFSFKAEAKVAACIAMISTWLVMFPYISIRPDAETTIIWIAGLFALEYASQKKWTFFSAWSAGALITYASVMHYLATFALLGAGAYFLSVWKGKGFNAMIGMAAKVSFGGAYVLIPYLALYVVPNWRDYKFVLNVGESSLSAMSFWKAQFDLYPGLAQAAHNFPWIISLPASWIFSLPASVGIPPFVIGIVGFATFPPLRLIGFAGLPMVLFVLAQSRKQAVYLYPEYFITVLGVAILVIVLPGLLTRILARPLRFDVRQAKLLPIFLFVLFLISLHPWQNFVAALASIERPKVLEEDIARAASIRAIGYGKLVGGRIGLWYVSGATRWYDISADALWYDNSKLNLPAYLGHFDYIVDHAFMADAPTNTPRANVSTWYGNGLLHLRGFYFGSNPTISYIRYSRESGPVVGNIYSTGALSEFREVPDGSAMLVSAFCSAKTAGLDSLQWKFASDRILLPVGGEVRLEGVGPGQEALIVAVAKDANELLKAVAQLKGCAVNQEVRGTIIHVDISKLLADYPKNPMNFDLMRNLIRNQYMKGSD
jgi:hypothetical protein